MNRDAGFIDRKHAGRELAREIATLDLPAPVILALPRGGVPVAYEIACELGAPLDLLMVRKIGAPGHEEFGIGAVVDGAAHQTVIDEAAARMVGADRAYIAAQVERQLAEIERRRVLYRLGRGGPLTGRTVVLVDDGIATGGTVRAAMQALARSGAAQVVLAVPVAPKDVLSQLALQCDRVICLATPEPFYAVGMHYRDFTQVEDEEVIRLLAEARSHAGRATEPPA